MNLRRADSLPTIWPHPQHTKAEHDILVKYLQAWFAIMGGSRFVLRPRAARGQNGSD
jgi:hypothetical protein